MGKKKKSNNTNTKNFQKVLKDQPTEKNNTLILGGILLAMSSIGLLIFVLSEKIFNLS